MWERGEDQGTGQRLALQLSELSGSAIQLTTQMVFMPWRKVFSFTDFKCEEIKLFHIAWSFCPWRIWCLCARALPSPSTETEERKSSRAGLGLSVPALPLLCQDFQENSASLRCCFSSCPLPALSVEEPRAESSVFSCSQTRCNTPAPGAEIPAGCPVLPEELSLKLWASLMVQSFSKHSLSSKAWAHCKRIPCTRAEQRNKHHLSHRATLFLPHQGPEGWQNIFHLWQGFVWLGASLLHINAHSSR